jgi:hypothetical protein
MIRPVAVSLLALLAVAACERQETPAAQPPAPTATTQGAPATSPAPATPAAADSNLVSAEGWGPLRVGMMAAEVTAAVGPDSQPNAVGGADPEACDEFHPARAPRGLRVMMVDGRLARITLARDATLKTDRGFGLGDPASAIKASYGGAVIAQPHKYQSAPAEDLFAWREGASTAYVTDPAARGIRYEVGSNGKVSMIHAGGPAIQYVEGCA